MRLLKAARRSSTIYEKEMEHDSHGSMKRCTLGPKGQWEDGPPGIVRDYMHRVQELAVDDMMLRRMLDMIREQSIV